MTLEAPFKMFVKNTERNYKQINTLYLDSDYNQDITQKAKALIKKVNNIASVNKYIEVEDSDYGSVPNYYINISIGDFDKPFKIIK